MYQICILFFAVDKLCRTLKNLVFHFVVGISRFCFLYYNKHYKINEEVLNGKTSFFVQ